MNLRSLLTVGFMLLLGVYGSACRHERRIDPAAEALLSQMRSAYETGNLGAVLLLADSTDSVQSSIPETDYLRGLVFNRMRRYSDAERVLGKVVAEDADFPGAWYHLGHAAFLQRQYRRALGHYRQEWLLLSRLRKEKDADNGFDPNELPNVIAQVGRTYEMMNIPDSARMTYQAALEFDPSHAVSNAWLSELYEKEGNVEVAFLYARKAARKEPGNMEYAYRLGSLYLQRGRTDAAAVILERVARAWPGHEGAAYNLGRALVAGGREVEGRRYLEQIPAIQKLQEEALLAERGVETYPNDAVRWIRLSDLMLRSGYLDKAEEALRAAMTLRPDDASIRNDFAGLAVLRGDTVAAVARYRDLLSRYPTDADAWLNLGSVYASAGLNEEARAAFQQSLRLRPDDADARAYLARIERIDLP